MSYNNKPCDPNKIRNPVTKRCVGRTTKLGMEILAKLQGPQGPNHPVPQVPNPVPQGQDKICPADKVLNPTTNRCVGRTTKLGKDILSKRQMVASSSSSSIQPKNTTRKVKPCPADKVLNPKTDRCVSRTSKLGKDILAKTVSVLPLPVRAMLPGQAQVQPMQLNKNKANVIARFMQRTKHARKANFLNTLCPESGVCIAFGTEQSNEIKKFFNGFSTFDYVSSFVRAGVPSVNGFIYAITYTHRGYTANAILKSSASPTADNLMYEYAVGRQINNLFYNKFPIFVETYNYYYSYPNEATWQKFKSATYTSTLKNALIPLDTMDYKKSCEMGKHLCILIQHIKQASTMMDMILSPDFVQNELLNSLYQVYFTLSAIKNRFTHYDLHNENVLIYIPNQTKYIQYHFHTGMEIITFKSRVMVKMIDYGRSYIETTTDHIKTNVCAEKACGMLCGKSRGYTLMPPASHQITPWKSNVSHDLRLLHMVRLSLPPNPPELSARSLRTVLDKVRYISYYGTAQKKQTMLPAGIGNVSDAEIALKELIQSGYFKVANDNYGANYTKSGDLHVYADGRDMNYIPFV